MKLYKEKFFSLEMGFSRKEFITLLSRQNRLSYQRDSNVITFTIEGQKALLTLGEEKVRQIASARLPQLDVAFSFSAMGDQQQADFMKRFWLTFHRGGG